MFLSVLYAMFAVLLFLAYASDHTQSSTSGDSQNDTYERSNSQFILDDRNNSPFMLSSEAQERPSDHRHSQFIIPGDGEEPKVGQFMTMT